MILNWNGLNHLKQFLPSVISHSQDIADIFVVDNGSSDESVTWLESNFRNVHLIKINKNLGFTGGYNLAIKEISHEIVVLLNSDVEVTSHWIEHVLQVFDSDLKIAAVQPKILSYRERNVFEYAGAGGGYIDFLAYPFCRGRLFNAHETDHGQYNDTRDVFWASGACMFVRRQLFEEFNGFDESFFAHNEEIDLCWRFKNKAYFIKYCGKSVVYHLGGGTLPKNNPFKTYLNFKNNLTMLLKNDFSGFTFSKFVLRLVLDGVAGIKFLVEGNYKDTLAVIKAHLAVYQRINSILDQRRQQKQKPYKPAEMYAGSIVWDHYILGKQKIEFPLN